MSRRAVTGKIPRRILSVETGDGQETLGMYTAKLDVLLVVGDDRTELCRTMNNRPSRFITMATRFAAQSA